jgi:hypothetical protein
MTLEEQLNDSESCVELGSSLSDKDFCLYQDRIVTKVCESAKSSYLAGRDWNDGRFEYNVDQIVKSVATDADACYWAGSEWKDERFNAHADAILEGVIQSSAWSREAGSDWANARFEVYAKEIAKAVVKDAYWLCEAEAFWPEDRQIYLYTTKVADEHLAVVMEAYHLSKENWEEFIEGLQAVQVGDHDKWAQHIIDHFTKGTIGGANYREVVV